MSEPRPLTHIHLEQTPEQMQERMSSILGPSFHRCTLFEHRHEKGNTYPEIDDDFELVLECTDPTHPPALPEDRNGVIKEAT